MLTGPMLKSIAGAVQNGDKGIQVASWDDLAAGCMEAAAVLGFTTYQGVATFIANCCQESDFFHTTREYGGLSQGHGAYYGRGFIQLTHIENYAAYGIWCRSRGLFGVDDPDEFVHNPDQVAAYEHAWWTAVNYFTKTWEWAGILQNLVKIADCTGSNLVVARAINIGHPNTSGTPNGISNRNTLFNKACTYGDQLMPEEDDMTPEEHKWLSSVYSRTDYLADTFAPKTYANASLAANRSGYVANTAVKVIVAQLTAIENQLHQLADAVGVVLGPPTPIDLPLPPPDDPDVPPPPGLLDLPPIDDPAVPPPGPLDQ